jgi:extracellular elastinolytic metalloproteinase
VQRAISRVRSKLPSDGSIGVLADGVVQTTSAGVRIVHLQQEYLGIPVHGGSLAVHFGSRGGVKRVIGKARRLRLRVATSPVVTAQSAVLTAARYVAEQVATSDRGPTLSVTSRPPLQLGRFAHPSRPTVLRKPPFRDPITARLVLFGTGLRLSWEIHLRLPAAGGEWDVIVAADGPNGENILHGWRTLAHATHGFVFDTNPDEEPRQRTKITFPCPRDHHPPFAGRMLPSGHEIWVSEGQTRGNNVVVFQENSKRTYAGLASNGDLVFEPADVAGMDQRMLNAFFVTNVLHDRFFLLGFDEAAGNFQGRNLSGQGEDDDHLVVRVFDQAIPGIATMRSRRDGNSPELNLGTHNGRHTALDAEIVIHEYVHGVTNRTIGGRNNHDPLRGKEQSEAMGEGYSDYFAVSMVNFRRRALGRTERSAYAAWISGNPVTGLRPHAYGPSFLLTYDAIRTTPNIRAHDAGQVWAQALLRVNEVLGEGDANLGDELGWQLVMDSLKLMPVGSDAPTFLHGRDALFQAFDASAGAGLVPATLRSGLEDVFAALGMGPAARSATARYQDIVAAFGA